MSLKGILDKENYKKAFVGMTMCYLSCSAPLSDHLSVDVDNAKFQNNVGIIKNDNVSGSSYHQSRTADATLKYEENKRILMINIGISDDDFRKGVENYLNFDTFDTSFRIGHKNKEHYLKNKAYYYNKGIDAFVFWWCERAYYEIMKSEVGLVKTNFEIRSRGKNPVFGRHTQPFMEGSQNASYEAVAANLMHKSYEKLLRVLDY